MFMLVSTVYEYIVNVDTVDTMFKLHTLYTLYLLVF